MSERILVGQVSDIPVGTMRLADVEGVPILLVNTGGRLYAVQTVCTHEAEPLIEGYLTDETLVCAYHGSEFDLATGEAIGPPAEEPLATYQVTVEDEDIFVEPTPA